MSKFGLSRSATLQYGLAGVEANMSQDGRTQKSSASEMEIAKEYSVVLADTDDEDDRYLNAFCESIQKAEEYRRPRGSTMALRVASLRVAVLAAAEEAACLDADNGVDQWRPPSQAAIQRLEGRCSERSVDKTGEPMAIHATDLHSRLKT